MKEGKVRGPNGGKSMGKGEQRGWKEKVLSGRHGNWIEKAMGKAIVSRCWEGHPATAGDRQILRRYYKEGITRSKSDWKRGSISWASSGGEIPPRRVAQGRKRQLSRKPLRQRGGKNRKRKATPTLLAVKGGRERARRWGLILS